jgi:hypothetical protein
MSFLSPFASEAEKLSFLLWIAELRHAYVKIEARILARPVREGITFVLFAADIP